MIDFVGALVASFVLGLIIGLRIRRLPGIVYVVMFLAAVAVSFMVGNFPFYAEFSVGGQQLSLNLVFITSFLGLLIGSALLGGGSQ
jgi:Na+/melibiose symporter-like transporter